MNMMHELNLNNVGGIRITRDSQSTKILVVDQHGDEMEIILWAPNYWVQGEDGNFPTVQIDATFNIPVTEED